MFMSTCRALETIAIETRVTSTGERSRCVEADGVVMTLTHLTLVYVLTAASVSHESRQAGADVGRSSGVAAESALRDVTVMSADTTRVHGTLHLNTRLSVAGELETVPALAAKRSWLVITDSVRSTDLRSFPAFIHVIASAPVSSEARGTFACELVSSSGSADGVSVAAVSASEAGVFLRFSTVDVSNLVTHGVTQELIALIIHDEHLVHTEHLCGRHGSDDFIKLAALKRDGLSECVASALG